MSRHQRPVFATVLLGGLGALSWRWAELAVGWHAHRSALLFSLLWCLLVLYALLLVRWSGRGWAAVIFPLAVLGLWGWQRADAGEGVVAALALLSWVRSGICFPVAPGPAIGREVAVGGGGLLAAALIPGHSLSWAAGIWVFFLVQALFFVCFETGADRRREKSAANAFERARHRAEKILDRR